MRVRVGNYNFDNTDHIYSEAYRRQPLRSRPASAGQRLSGVPAGVLAGHRSRLQDRRGRYRAQAVVAEEHEPAGRAARFFHGSAGALDLADRAEACLRPRLGRSEVIRLSALFGAYPKVLRSGVEMQISQSTNYIVTLGRRRTAHSRGSGLRSRGGARPGADGTEVRDDRFFQAFEADGLPSEEVLSREVEGGGRACHRAQPGSRRRSVRRSRAV